MSEFVRSHYPEVEGMEMRNGAIRLLSGATWNYDAGGYVALANVGGMLATVQVTITEVRVTVERLTPARPGRGNSK